MNRQSDYAILRDPYEAIERKHVWGVPHDGYIFVSGYCEPRDWAGCGLMLGAESAGRGEACALRG